MAKSLSPFKLKDTDVQLVEAGGTFGADTSFRCQLTKAELVPSASSSGDDLETFCATHSDSGGDATWELQLDGFQGTDAEDLAMLAFDHEGEEFDFLLIPKGGVISTTNPGFQGTITLTPTSIGGQANAWATYSATFKCKQKPVKVTAPVVAAVAAAAKKA